MLLPTRTGCRRHGTCRRIYRGAIARDLVGELGRLDATSARQPGDAAVELWLGRLSCGIGLPWQVDGEPALLGLRGAGDVVDQLTDFSCISAARARPSATVGRHWPRRRPLWDRRRARRRSGLPTAFSNSLLPTVARSPWRRFRSATGASAAPARAVKVCTGSCRAARRGCARRAATVAARRAEHDAVESAVTNRGRSTTTHGELAAQLIEQHVDRAGIDNLRLGRSPPRRRGCAGCRSP